MTLQIQEQNELSFVGGPSEENNANTLSDTLELTWAKRE